MTLEELRAVEAIQDIARDIREIRYGYEKPQIIDWEERRYEIARDMVAAFMSNSCENIFGGGSKALAKDAVAFADDLIEELKKSKS